MPETKKAEVGGNRAQPVNTTPQRAVATAAQIAPATQSVKRDVHPDHVTAAHHRLRKAYYDRLGELGLPPDMILGWGIEARAEALLRIEPSPRVQKALERLRELRAELARARSGKRGGDQRSAAAGGAGSQADRVLDLIQCDPRAEYTPRGVARALGIPERHGYFHLAALARQGWAIRLARGVYRAALARAVRHV